MKKKQTPKDLVESLLNEATYKEGQRVILKSYPKGHEDFPDGLPEERGTIEGVEGHGMYVVRVDDQYMIDGDRDGLREVHVDQIQGLDKSSPSEKAPQGKKLTWQDASKKIPYDRPASDAVMKSFVLADGTPIFGHRKGRWYANADSSKTVRTAYDLAQGFVSENGGQIFWRMVAMFALAVEADNAAGMPKRDITNITAGFEEGSTEAKLQKKMGKTYPNIQAAILSFF